MCVCAHACMSMCVSFALENILISFVHFVRFPTTGKCSSQLLSVLEPECSNKANLSPMSEFDGTTGTVNLHL